ncbi:hypothetical protein [Bosea sp. (in: a-proteobacteria)]|uniref:hypothetical protein n=1 Tax=Bosea sp. (in: a-proteobacteria) TaxID=1871050 RepID=UPI002732E41A|nr:hypothetical protein [Bosea sp. (in: a-proteobacteria)]MDP3407262.1 hypothetical protein [Bosea sp. (in: a-proteobacteria)]
MLTLTDQMLTVAKAYCEALGVTLSVASRRAFDESKLLVDLDRGHSSPTLKRSDRALRWFSDNWPEGHAWPSDVPRPVPTDTAERAA